MNKALNLQVLGTLLLAGGSLWVAGCKSAPELSQADAQKMIQADYDGRPAAGAGIYINEIGLKQGLNDKYWKLTKVYPNMRWADYTLTDDGKKVLRLEAGGDLIQWRPEQGTDSHFYVITVQQNHFRAKEVSDPQDEVVPGVDKAKSSKFAETLNLDGVPPPLVDLAHNAGNQLSSKKTADFALENGVWKLHGIH